MRTHTSEFKEELKVFGRQIQGKITYYPSYDLVSESDDNILTEADLQIISEQANYDEPIEINEEDIFSISIIKNGDLLQSLMKEFDFETKVELNIGSVVNPQFGLLVNEDYEYLDYGNYIINSKEFNMDTETWSYVCYDKMLFSMVKYRGLSNIEYPITIKQYINLICNKIGLEFEDSDFVNQNQLIYEDLYKNRDVTYRDIFDEISKVVAGNLLINDNDKLEVGYVKLATTKNLLNIQTIVKGRLDNGVIGYEDGISELVLNNDSFSFTTIANYRGVTSDYISVKPNTNYIFSMSTNYNQIALVVAFYDENKNFLSDSSIGASVKNKTFETVNDCHYIRVYFYRSSASSVTINYPQLEEGTEATSYERSIETINEDYLKDTNVRMSEKIGVINSVAILDSDNNLQYIAEDTQSIKENQMTRVTVTDNLIAMNGETQEIANNILNKLNGLYYYANDLQTTGVCYYDFLDMFNIEARGNIYQCLLLNNEITITQGIEEHIFTEKFEEIETSKEEYTTSVITNKQASLKINQQEAKIEARVEKDGIISAINLSPEEIQIEANKISLEGKEINLTSDDIVIESTNFSVDKNGKITATAGEIGGFITNNDSFSKNVFGLYNYNNFDSTMLGMYIVNRRVSLNDNLVNVLDVDSDGEVSSVDYVKIKNIINGTSENTKEVSATFEINSNNPKDCVVVKDENGNIVNSIGVGGINSTCVITDNFICGKVGESYSNFNGATINGTTGNITCVSLTQTSKEENKKNFEKLINAKDILNQVDIYKYNFKDEDDDVKKSIGFVIGDKFNYSQEITSENNDGANIYSMVSVLWQVVKEYVQIIDKQQEEIKELKEMIKNGKY